MKKNKVMITVFILVLMTLPVIVAAKTPPGQAKKTKTTTSPTTTSTTTKSTTQPTTTSTVNSTNWDMWGAILGAIAIVGAIIGWYFSKRQSSKTSKYLKKINETYDQYKSNTTKCEAKLSALKAMIEKEFTDGKLDQGGMAFLDKRIDKYVNNLRVGMVESFDVSKSTKQEVEEMLEDGIITEKEYNRFLQRKKMDQADFERLHKQMDKWRAKSKKKIPIKNGGKKKVANKKTANKK